LSGKAVKLEELADDDIALVDDKSVVELKAATELRVDDDCGF
jgi:hypothetical protein